MIFLLDSYSNKTSSMMGQWREFFVMLYHISKSIIKLNSNVLEAKLSNFLLLLGFPWRSLLYSSKRNTRIFHLLQMSLDLSCLDLVEFDWQVQGLDIGWHETDPYKNLELNIRHYILMTQDLSEFPDLPATLREFIPFLLSFSASAQHTSPKI